MHVTTVVTLSPKERDFVFGLAHGLPPTVAATEAGYAMSTGRLLLAKHHIRQALEDVRSNTTRILERLERREAKRERAA